VIYATLRAAAAVRLAAGGDDIARAGPERIARIRRERSSTRLRDYYRVEDVAGRRYWIYRQGRAGDAAAARLNGICTDCSADARI
jgi:hypothetical protein